MDLLSMFKSLLGSTDIASKLEKQAIARGVPASVVSEFAQGAQQILADGKVSKEEVVQQLFAHAQAHGVPVDVVEKAVGALKK